MKRTVYLLLAAFMLFSFSACGKEPDKNGEYRYDVLESRGFLRHMDVFRGGAIEGGSLLFLSSDIFNRQDYPVDASGASLYYLFDEGSKVLMPLCFDSVCNHRDSSCFAYRFYASDPHSFYGIKNDRVIVIGDYSEGKGILHAYIYTIDGVLEDKVLFDMSELVGDSAEKTSDVWFYHDYCQYGSKVYLDVANYLSDPNYSAKDGERFDRWLVEFDMDTLKFKTVCAYSVPDDYDFKVRFNECDGKFLSFEYDNRYAYKVDLSTGEYTEINIMDLVDGLIVEGKLPVGTAGMSLLPVNGIAVTNVANERVFFDLETKEQLELSEGEVRRLTTSTDMVIEGKQFFLTESSGTTEVYTCYETGETFTLDITFAGGKYKLVYDAGFNAEKGLVQTYAEVGAEEEDRFYVKNVGGVDMEYRRAYRYIYVTYEDILDGKIDEPYYFDSETGLFEKD